MADEGRTFNPGALLAGLGILIFAAVIVTGYFGRRIPFFGQNLFIPILMIFVGRAMSRRHRARDTSGPQPTTPPSRPRPPTRSSPPPPPRTLTSRPAPSPLPTPEIVVPPLPQPVPPTPREPEPPPMRRPPPPQPKRADPVHYPTTGRKAKAPEAEPRRADPVHYPTTGRKAKAAKHSGTPKTSEEMIAEAKERLKRKG